MLLLQIIIIFLTLVLLYIFRQKEQFKMENITLNGLYDGDTVTLFWYNRTDINKDDFTITITTTPTTTPNTTTPNTTISPETLINVKYDEKIQFYKKRIAIKENCEIKIEDDKNSSNTITINTKDPTNYNTKQHIDHKIQCFPDGSTGVTADCISRKKFPNLELHTNWKNLRDIVYTLLRKNIILQ